MAASKIEELEVAPPQYVNMRPTDVAWQMLSLERAGNGEIYDGLLDTEQLDQLASPRNETQRLKLVRAVESNPDPEQPTVVATAKTPALGTTSTPITRVVALAKGQISETETGQVLRILEVHTGLSFRGAGLGRAVLRRMVMLADEHVPVEAALSAGYPTGRAFYESVGLNFAGYGEQEVSGVVIPMAFYDIDSAAALMKRLRKKS